MIQGGNVTRLGHCVAGPAPCVLTIAGSDSGGGAGVLADARVVHALGGYACMAVTALTAQNLRGVVAWRPVPAEMIRAQIGAVLGARPGGGRVRAASGQAARVAPHGVRAGGKFRIAGGGALPIGAVKTGLLPGAAAIRAVAEMLGRFESLPIVVDPVIRSSGGTSFLDKAGVKVMRKRLLPMAVIVTPNWPETEALTGRRVGSFDQAEAAGRALAADAGCAVLVKGGHARGSRCMDILVIRERDTICFNGKRIATKNTHGTGCVLSAAIAAELAKGAALVRAVETARTFLRDGLLAGRRIGWPGVGPAWC